MSDLDGLNAADPSAFVDALAPLFEGAPRFLDRLAASRPFESWEELMDVARGIAHVMPEAEQVELVDAHPRLGAPPATVSAMSFREQGYGRDTGPGAGPGDASATEARAAAEAERQRLAMRFDELNAAYEARFGFRYCVFVAGRSRSELIPEFEAALSRERDSELHRALDAVVDIAADRQRRERRP